MSRRRCGRECQEATGVRCECRCGGRHHGRRWKKAQLGLFEDRELEHDEDEKREPGEDG